MGVRGLRRGNTDKQILGQLQDAADALLAVVKMLRARGVTRLGKDSANLLAAVERRTKMVRETAALERAADSREGEDDA